MPITECPMPHTGEVAGRAVAMDEAYIAVETAAGGPF